MQLMMIVTSMKKGSLLLCGHADSIDLRMIRSVKPETERANVHSLYYSFRFLKPRVPRAASWCMLLCLCDHPGVATSLEMERDTGPKLAAAVHLIIEAGLKK
jgi:hypothetical protein